MTKKQMKLLIKKRERLGYYSAPSILIDTLFNDTEDIPDEYIEIFSHNEEESSKLVIYCGTELYEKLKIMNTELQETERLKISN